MLGGISTKTCYELLSSGQIKAMKIGRAYRIPKINVMKYLKIV
ncbi:MAG: helix-turn-helix domain-containing protein [Oscillospiraceae bacterium]|nr:helix-turn-helix domain-containing protein [Oscillospiraceae bacterium]